MIKNHNFKFLFCTVYLYVHNYIVSDRRLKRKTFTPTDILEHKSSSSVQFIRSPISYSPVSFKGCLISFFSASYPPISYYLVHVRTNSNYKAHFKSSRKCFSVSLRFKICGLCAKHHFFTLNLFIKGQFENILS